MNERRQVQDTRDIKRAVNRAIVDFGHMLGILPAAGFILAIKVGPMAKLHIVNLTKEDQAALAALIEEEAERTPEPDPVQDLLDASHTPPPEAA